MNAVEYSRKLFGARTAPRAFEFLIPGITDYVEVLPNNPNRVEWVLTNPNYYDVIVRIDVAHTEPFYFVLPALGGFCRSKIEEDGEMTTYAIKVSARGNITKITALEVVFV